MNRTLPLVLVLLVGCGQNQDTPVCGNTIVEAGEGCDDGNNNDADGCEANCALPSCQNNIDDPGESCFLDQRVLLRSAPLALASGDLDGDGRAELISANAASHDLSVFPGSAAGFLAQRRFSLNSAPSALVLADVNADTRLDIVLISEEASTISLLLNQSTPGILDLAGVVDTDVGGLAPKALLTADLNADGLADFITANAGSDDLSLFLGQVGQIPSPTQIAVGARPGALLALDLDADADLDLVTANALGDSISLLTNDGLGGLSAPVEVQVGKAPKALAALDFTADGVADLAVANALDNSISLLENQAGVLVPVDDGTGAPLTLAVGFFPQALVAIDLNSDGLLDLASLNTAGGDASLLVQQAAGQFAAATRLEVGELPSSLLVSSLDGDAALDLVVANQGSDDLSLILASGGFSIEDRLDVGGQPQGLFPFDIDGDGDLELLVPNGGADDLSVVSNDAVQGATVLRLPAGNFPVAAAAGDLSQDGDQLLDLVTVDSLSNSVSVILHTAASGFAAPISIAVGQGPVAVVVGDFSGDGLADLVTANTFSDNLTLLTNGGGGVLFTPSVVTATGLAFPIALSAGDMDGDGDLDLVTTNGLTGDFFVLLQNGGAFNLGGRFQVGDTPQALALGDLNGDQKLDVIAAARGDDQVKVFLNVGAINGQVQFKSPLVLATGVEPSAVSLGDLDGDQNPDILIADRGSKDLSIFLNQGEDAQGNLQLVSQGFVVLDETPFGVLSLDLNGDALGDLLSGSIEDRSLRALLAAP